MAPDVEDDLFGDSARVARATSTVVMRLMEQLQRGREERSRREADGHREAAQALAERQRAQQESMRAIVSPARDGQWLDRASDRDVAIAYVYAEAYADHDDLARHTRDSLAERLKSRHGDVATFVDSQLSAEDIERVPVPPGADLSPSQARLVAAREETAQKWANVVEVSGGKEASRWLAANLDEAEKARLEGRRLEDSAARQRGEASDERAEAAEVEGPEKDEQLADAEEHEARAASDEHEADLERSGHGKIHQHDPAKAQESRLSSAEQQEAAEAARAAQGGREEPVRTQIANQRKQREGRHRQPRQSRRLRANQDQRERGNERGR